VWDGMGFPGLPGLPVLRGVMGRYILGKWLRYHDHYHGVTYIQYIRYYFWGGREISTLGGSTGRLIH